MQAVWRHFNSLQRPGRDDFVLALGVLVLTIALLLLSAVSLLNRLEAGVRVEAVKGNAATLQLAAESFARQHLGRYPASTADLLAYLPGRQPPANPLDGRPLTFARRPGDVTYTPLDGGRRYRIRAWIYGAQGGCRELLTLAGGSGSSGRDQDYVDSGS